jgi:hypothetical protein
MEDFVDEAECVDLTGFDSLFGVGDQIALLVYFLSEDSRSMEVGEQNITSEAKEGLVKLIVVACLPGNMEFHTDSLDWYWSPI